jgi:CO/xanthine dehydrogenase Mo-binding subunit
VAEAGSSFTRREFLIRTGWVAGGTTILTACPLPTLPTFRAPDADDAPSWLQLLPEGRIRFYSPKSEMGQGIRTGLAQVVAEELNVEFAEIEVVSPDTHQIPPVLVTAGSRSMKSCFEPVSHAGALLRETLRRRAALRLGVNEDSIRDGRGGFVCSDGARIAYAELVGDEARIITADSEIARPPPRHSVDRSRKLACIGLSQTPVDLEAIVTGREVYSRDVVVPGMLHGGVVRPPRPGAALAKAKLEAAKGIDGVVEVIVNRDEDRVGVVAESPLVLERAVAAMELEWNGGAALAQNHLDHELDVERARERDDFEHTADSEGHPRRAAAAAVHRLRARYDTPLWAHAAMEPRAGVVSVTPDAAEVWTASQDPWYMQGLVAKITGRGRGGVILHNLRMGGAFGGRKRCQATLEAAWLSSSVGRPVRVQWSREHEFRDNYLQPPFSHWIDAGVDAEGRLTHWLHDFTACPIGLDSATIPRRLHWLADLVGDPGTKRGALTPYRVSDRRTRFSDVRIPIHTGQWRGLGAAPNTTAIELAMDELAQAAGIDAIEFRLRNLGPERERLAAVLREVARLSSWGEPVGARRGRGLACAVYEEMTYVAVVLEVALDDGVIRPVRAWCAHDCGLVVNPGQVTAQIEGNIAWGCSVALQERAEIRDGANANDSFETYPILRQADSPEVEVSLLEHPGDPPTGAGEPAIAPTPAALINAVFAATGTRHRRLPIRA